MKTLQEWFSHSTDVTKEVLGLEELVIILNELNHDRVAIKGSNIFPINYNLLANVMC